jgi:hypothetical protein
MHIIAHLLTATIAWLGALAGVMIMCVHLRWFWAGNTAEAPSWVGVRRVVCLDV